MNVSDLTLQQINACILLKIWKPNQDDQREVALYWEAVKRVKQPESPSPAKRSREPFVKPTVEQVKEHGATIGVDEQTCEKFWYFYESKGWKVGKNSMKCWKSAMVTWKKTDGFVSNVQHSITPEIQIKSPVVAKQVNEQCRKELEECMEWVSPDDRPPFRRIKPAMEERAKILKAKIEEMKKIERGGV